MEKAINSCEIFSVQQYLTKVLTRTDETSGK